MNICIIPARGGSQRIPGKNIKPFHGKPIICYSIDSALRSGLFDKVIVSTDSQEIANVAMSARAKVWMRKPRYAVDSVGTQEVARECIEGMRFNKDDIVCCLYATAPLMSIFDLERGYNEVVNDPNCDFAMSVGYPPLQDAAQFYWGMAGCFLENRPLISRFTRMVHIVDERVCDINTPEDWDKALRMYEDLHK